MIARVAVNEGGDPDRREEVRSYVVNNIIPKMRGTRGLKRVMTFLDGANRRALAISLWDSEDDMRAAEPQMQENARNIPNIGQQLVRVETYEIVLDEDMT